MFYFEITNMNYFFNRKTCVLRFFFNWLVHPNDENFIIYVPWFQYFWYTGKCQNKIKERCIDFLKIPSDVKIKQMISRQQRKWINIKLKISLQRKCFSTPFISIISNVIKFVHYCWNNKLQQYLRYIFSYS